MTGWPVFSSNSVEFASFQPSTFRANSITQHCMPRQMPSSGTLRSRAHLIAAHLPSTPRLPKPPGIRIPSAFATRPGSFSSSSASTHSTFTFASQAMPACCSASCTDL